MTAALQIPPCRTMVVQKDWRTLIVAADTRTYVVAGCNGMST